MFDDRFSVYLVDIGGKRSHADRELPVTCKGPRADPHYAESRTTAATVPTAQP